MAQNDKFNSQKDSQKQQSYSGGNKNAQQSQKDMPSRQQSNSDFQKENKSQTSSNK